MAFSGSIRIFVKDSWSQDFYALLLQDFYTLHSHFIYTLFTSLHWTKHTHAHTALCLVLMDIGQDPVVTFHHEIRIVLT